MKDCTNYMTIFGKFIDSKLLMMNIGMINLDPVKSRKLSEVSTYSNQDHVTIPQDE